MGAMDRRLAPDRASRQAVTSYQGIPIAPRLSRTQTVSAGRVARYSASGTLTSSREVTAPQGFSVRYHVVDLESSLTCFAGTNTWKTCGVDRSAIAFNSRPAPYPYKQVVNPQRSTPQRC